MEFLIKKDHSEGIEEIVKGYNVSFDTAITVRWLMDGTFTLEEDIKTKVKASEKDVRLAHLNNDKHAFTDRNKYPEDCVILTSCQYQLIHDTGNKKISIKEFIEIKRAYKNYDIKSSSYIVRSEDLVQFMKNHYNLTLAKVNNDLFLAYQNNEQKVHDAEMHLKKDKNLTNKARDRYKLLAKYFKNKTE